MSETSSGLHPDLYASLKKVISKPRKPPRSVSLVAINSNFAILTVLELIEQQLKFGIPGGKPAYNEHPVDTLAREFYEETGYMINGQFLNVLTIRNDMIIFVYVANSQQELVPLASQKPSALYISWLSLETIIDATQLKEELFFQIDNNSLKYRDETITNQLANKRKKRLYVISEPVYISSELGTLQGRGFRIRQAFRNDLNNPKFMQILSESVHCIQ